MRCLWGSTVAKEEEASKATESPASSKATDSTASLKVGESPASSIATDSSGSSNSNSKSSQGSGSLLNDLGNPSKERKRLPRRQTHRCSAVAMDYWNRNLRQEGETEFVLVELVCSGACVYEYRVMHHANFKARPKKDRSAEPHLFFAELS